jgi:DNA polymerase elongation subunit (family B)
MQTERVTFLTSPDQKAALDEFAAKAGQSVGHVLREASTRYIAQPTAQEERELDLLVRELNEAVPRIRASLERSIKKLDQTRREVASMLREAGIRK